MRVDPTLFAGVRGQELIERKIDGVVMQSEQDNDPIYLSDLLIYKAAGPAEPLLKVLRDDPAEIYKIHCIRDEWGNVPQPGDVVQLKRKLDLVRNARPVSSHDIQMWKIQGIYERKMFQIKKFIVDEKGCISCNGQDAQDFLRLYGIHSATGYNISQHTMEHSEEPCNCPDGSKKHVWYYRFKECEKEVYPYDKLEAPVKPEAPKRGYKKEDSSK